MKLKGRRPKKSPRKRKKMLRRSISNLWYFLPRNKKLSEAQIVMLRYDEAVAMEALALLEVLIDAAELVGWDKVIAKQPKASFCWDCKKYDQQEDEDISSLI